MLAAHKVMFLESSLFTAALVVGAVLAGLWAGGRALAIALRMSKGRRITLEASTCPSCGERLRLGEVIPLLSYIRQRGVCAHCGAPISVAYPASELLGAGIFASVVLRHGVSLQTLEILAFVAILMVLSLASLIDYRVPNRCILWAVLVRAAYLGALLATGQDVVDLALTSLVGAVALGLPLLVAVWLSNAMLARDITGLGTVKLVFVVGLYLGWQQGLFCIAGAFLLGAFVWLISPSKLLDVEVEGGPQDAADATANVAVTEPKPSFEEDIAEPMRLIPFAPSIAIACWVMLLLGVAPALWNMPII